MSTPAAPTRIDPRLPERVSPFPWLTLFAAVPFFAGLWLLVAFAPRAAETADRPHALLAAQAHAAPLEDRVRLLERVVATLEAEVDRLKHGTHPVAAVRVAAED